MEDRMFPAVTSSGQETSSLASTIQPSVGSGVVGYHATPDNSWMEQGYNIASISIGATVLGLSLGFIIVTNATASLRKDSAKWLQQTVAYGITLYVANEFMDPHLPWQVSGVCEFFWPLTWSCRYLIYLGLMLVTVERGIAVWKEDPGVPAISQLIAAVCIGVVATCSVALGYGVTFGMGKLQTAVTPENTIVCDDDGDLTQSSTLDFAHTIAHGTLSIVLLIPTAICIGRLCRSRVCVATNPFILFDSDKVMPILVGNLILVLTVLVDIVLKQTRPDVLWKTEPFGLIIMLALWIGWDQEVRSAYGRICCPCCCGERKESETIGLLESKDDKIRDEKRQKYDVVNYNSQ